MAKVLYLDDNPHMVRAMGMEFERFKRTQPALDIELTAKTVTPENIPAPSEAMGYDALVLDYDWKRAGNGVDFARTMRAEGYRGKIFMYSSHSEEAIRGFYPDCSGLELGFVKKALSSDNLFEALQSVVATSQASAGVAGRSPQVGRVRR